MGKRKNSKKNNSLKIIILIGIIIFLFCFLIIKVININNEKESGKNAAENFNKDVNDSINNIKKIIDNNYKKNILETKFLLCPEGNYSDSLTETNDFFTCLEIKYLLDENTKEHISYNCSVKDNYDKENVSIEIKRLCRNGDSFIVGDCEFFGGIYKPSIVGKSYPSLNEYYFNSISLEFNNLGCTKINAKNYSLVYSLYQNNSLIKSSYDYTAIDYFYNLVGGEDFVYPEGWIMFSIGFGEDRNFPTQVKLNSPDNLTFKVCLKDIYNNKIINCDEENFNIEY